jgi:hypothetical protein
VLDRYVTDVQNFLNDQQGQFFAVPTLHNYINRARRRVAAVSGCIRLLPEGTQTVARQETYPFSAWKSLVQAKPGVDSILAVRSLAVAIGPGGWKPVWRRIPWTDFQARFRLYNKTWLGALSEPGWFSQYGVGNDAVLYLAPIPAMAMPMELDFSCLPLPLLTDDDPEPLVYPWTDAVAYWAATLALMQQQRLQDAKVMADLFNTDLPMCAAVVCPQMIVNPHGATLRSA